MDEISQFKSEILENRNKFLIKKEKDLEDSANLIFKELSKLEEERTLLLKQLQEKGALDKLESTYEELIKQQSLVERQNQILIQVDEYNRILSDQEIVLSQIKRDISQGIQNVEKELNELRELFNEILSSALFLDEEDSSGYFDISLSRKSKANLPFKIDVNIPRKI